MNGLEVKRERLGLHTLKNKRPQPNVSLKTVVGLSEYAP